MNEKNLRLQLEQLSNSNKDNTALLAKYLLEYTGDIAEIKIKQLSEKSYVSTATATRLAQKVGLSGFTELKILLALENQNSNSSKKMIKNENLDNYVKKINEALLKTVDEIDYLEIKKISQKIIQSKYIYFFGSGGTYFCIQDLANKLKRLKYNIQIDSDINNQYFHAQNADENDICIGVSYSGITQEVLKALNIAKKNNVKTCLITSNKNVKKDEYTHVIYLHQSEKLERNFSITSRTSILVVLDQIYFNVFNANFEKNEKKLIKNHYPK